MLALNQFWTWFALEINLNISSMWKNESHCRNHAREPHHNLVTNDQVNLIESANFSVSTESTATPNSPKTSNNLLYRSTLIKSCFWTYDNDDPYKSLITSHQGIKIFFSESYLSSGFLRPFWTGSTHFKWIRFWVIFDPDLLFQFKLVMLTKKNEEKLKTKKEKEKLCNLNISNDKDKYLNPHGSFLSIFTWVRRSLLKRWDRKLAKTTHEIEFEIKWFV